jgi:hypothetical protein
MPKGIFRLTREYLVCSLYCRAGDSAIKTRHVLEELATLKRTTYSYGEAVNELWER